MSITTVNPTTIRKLKINERKFLWGANAYVSVSMRLFGDLPNKKLQNGLHFLSIKHPFITSYIKIDKNHEAFFMSDPKNQPSIKLIQRKNDFQIFEEIQKEYLIPFDFSQGPLIRFIQIYSPQISDLIVICQHSICDGTALAYLLKDLVEFSFKEPENLEVLDPSEVTIDLITEKNSKSLTDKIKSIMFGIINKKWQKNPYYFDIDDFLGMHEKFIHNFKSQTLPVMINEEQSEKLSIKCHENGVTINSALCNAFIEAYEDINGKISKKKRNLVMPFDLRSRTDPPMENVLCLFVGSVEIPINYNKNANFWENTKKLHNTINSKISNRDIFSSAAAIENLEPTLIDAMFLSSTAHHLKDKLNKNEKIFDLMNDEKNIALKFSSKFSDSLPAIINTNLGKIRIPAKIGELTIDSMYFIPSGSLNIPLLLGCVGAGGKITITINFLKKIGDDSDKINRFYEEVKDKALRYLELV